ncbi:MAG: RsmE family RNA methyltransferase, partial [Bacteroidales bacterium]
ELHLAISPTKNPDRMEWLVEKSIEIGVEKLTFIICEHSERPRLDLERMKRVGISALKQSNTTWLPYMEILSYRDFMIQHGDVQVHKFIAWCDDSNEKQLTDQLITMNKVMLLIGPEGDFSEEEIQLAKHYHFTEVKLGNRRLRTETAGLYGCCVLAGKAEEK